MKLFRPVLFCLMFPALTAPCLADDEAAADEEKKVCVNSRQIRSFDGLSDQHVFIEERSKKYFLMTMRGYCPGLRNANAIAIKDTMTRVCSKGFGEVIYRDMGRRFESCNIETIERVENKDEARALIAERKEAKKKKKKGDSD